MGNLKFSANSEAQLETCRPELQILARRSLAVSLIDFKVLEGHRDRDRQTALYKAKKSKKLFPHSKHNKMLSEAFDLAPVINGKVSWDPHHHIYLAGIVLTVAQEFLSLTIRWGANWDMDLEPVTDHSFRDFGHYEIY